MYSCKMILFISFGKIPRLEIPGWNGISSVGSLRNLYTDFLNGCSSLQSHQQCRRPKEFQKRPLELMTGLINAAEYKWTQKKQQTVYQTMNSLEIN